MLGFDSTAELVGCTSADILYDPAEEKELSASLATSLAMNNAEFRLRRKDGTALWGLHNVRLVASENGRPPCIEGTVIDITKRKNAENALQKQLSLMQTVTSTAPNGLFLLDPEGRLTFMNPAAERMLGYTTTELEGKVMHDVCHYRRRDGSPLPKSECPIAQAYGSGMSFNGYEDVHYRKDGTGIEMSFSGAPLFEGERLMGAVLVAQDITERKLAEQRYQALHEQFLQAQKMEAVGRLAGGIAHDFNNLLQVINGYSSLIVEERCSDPQLARRASAIHEAGNRAARLTQQLLDFSRKSASDAHVISLDKAVLEMTKMLRTMVGEDVEFSTRMRSNGASVRINAGQLEQLIMNLAVNARDAMPKGGKLHLETRCLNLKEGQRNDFGFIPAAAYVRLSVSDTGCGMDADTISHAFEPFFTTKERGKGTGLGLSTVYGIVTQNGGGIQIESAPGAGTTVHICLPQAAPGIAHSEIVARTSRSNGTECILLAEDEDNVRSLIAGELTRLGYRVIEAGRGVDALQLATKAPQSFDLLITDMIMPMLSGHELSQKILDICPAIKIIQMSGYNDARQSTPGDEIPNVENLQKPFRNPSTSPPWLRW
jgi:PAS domain S-box-containing protein